MKNFLYYSASTDDTPEDVALVSAKSLKDAEELLRKYYTKVESKIHIYEIKTNHKYTGSSIIIISDY